MKRGRFSDEQIIGILKEQEAGSATADAPKPVAIPSTISHHHEGLSA
jgi:hypothetical protein